MAIIWTDDGPITPKTAFWPDGGYDGDEWTEWETGYSISDDADPLTPEDAESPWTVWHGDGRGNGDFVARHPTLDDALEWVRASTDGVDPVRAESARFTRHGQAGSR